ncbi:lipocalin-like domain-containing protein [Gramella sp. GC03-9]|uniref:Lipocalin-like domain-containing protein n=1 Tax=Christiangramia oceanisediminis TaxID=2920386 RepID=A0A9X2KYT2_9FLAO|nr:lipocalin-like domain-containing protein [Gramella oceanisediminis]MCP9200853.1 lipocalin-like domain-containing protein [Gramella oceanisediminis]
MQTSFKITTLFLILSISLLCTQCKQQEKKSISQASDFEKFTGRWKLGNIQVQDTLTKAWNNAGGLNKDRKGFIIYDGLGGMGVHHVSENYEQYILEGKGGLDSLSQKDLKKMATNFVYFGKYRVNEDDKTIEHHIESHIYPQAWNTIAERRYEFREDSLILSPINGNFTAPVRLVWLKLDDRPK